MSADSPVVPEPRAGTQFFNSLMAPALTNANGIFESTNPRATSGGSAEQDIPDALGLRHTQSGWGIDQRPLANDSALQFQNQPTDAGALAIQKHHRLLKEKKDLEQWAHSLGAVNAQLKMDLQNANKKADDLQKMLKEAKNEINVRLAQEEALATRLLDVETILVATRFRYKQARMVGIRERARANALHRVNTDSNFPEDAYITKVLQPMRLPQLEEEEEEDNPDDDVSNKLSLFPPFYAEEGAE